MSPPGACVVSGSVPTVDLIGRLVNDRTGVVLQLSGEIDLSTVPTLHDHLARAAAESRGATLHVDVDGVTALDDVGLGVMLGWAGRQRESGGELVLVCTSERLLQRFSITGLSRAIAVADRLAD
mgnify:CR=1 FL=1